VTHELVWKTELLLLVVDLVHPHHHGVVEGSAPGQPLALKGLHLVVETEGAGRRDVPKERFRGHDDGKFLFSDERVLELDRAVHGEDLGGVQAQGGLSGRVDDRLVGRQILPGTVLGGPSGLLQQFHERAGAAVGDRRLVGVHLDDDIVDVEPLQGGEHVFHRVDLDVVLVERGAADHAGDAAEMGRQHRLVRKVDAHERDPGSRRRRFEPGQALVPGVEPDPFEHDFLGDGVLHLVRRHERHLKSPPFSGSVSIPLKSWAAGGRGPAS